jgi:hypothetical protein
MIRLRRRLKLLARGMQVAVVIAATSSDASGASPSSTDANPSTAELLRKIEALEAKVQTLQNKVERYESVNHYHGTTPMPTARPLEQSDPQTPDAAAGGVPINEVNGTGFFGLGYRSKAILQIGAYGEL